MLATFSIARLCFLISLFHVVLVVCTVVIQKLEYYRSEKSSYVKYAKLADDMRKEHEIRHSERSIAGLRKVFYEEQQEKIREQFNGLENAYLFMLTSFTALGNSGLRPATWQGKLFYSFIIPFGFAIYVYIIISFAYHFRDFIVFCIMSLENKKTSEIRFLSTKILMTSLASCLCVSQIGGIISAIDGSGYLNGMYIAVDTMTFTGNESLVKEKAKLAFLFLLSFYFMSLHSLILVFVCDLQQTWNEITSKWNDTKPDYLYQESRFSPEHNYKYKLLASFDSPSSLTPVSDEDAGDVCFPQMWSLQYEFEPALPNEPLMVGQTERKSSRFSEIFNAQKELFEPIIELAEHQEEEDLSDSSSYKSSYDFFLPAESEQKLQNCLNDLDQFQIADNTGKDEKLSSGESASTDTNKNLLPRLSYAEDTHRDM